MADSDTVAPGDLYKLFSAEATVFSEPMLRESLYKHYSQKLVLEAEYRDMSQRNSEILAREQKRSDLAVFSAAMFFTAQFGISYYTIFEVSWLGWDLVEPCTYSVTQGSSILGLAFLYRHRHMGVEYSNLSDYL